MKVSPVFVVISLVIGASIAGRSLPIGPARAEVTRSFKHEWALDNETHLNIDHSHGNLILEAWDHNSLQLEGEKRVRAKNDEIANQFLDEMEVKLERDGNEINILTSRPKQNRSWLIREATINYTLHAPHHLYLSLKQRHGNLVADRFTQGGEFHSQHGNIQVAGLGGDLSLSHQHGNVDFGPVGGHVKINKAHGKLQLARIEGNADVRHEHGNVTLSEVTGTLKARKEHGNLHVERIGDAVDIDHNHGRLSLSEVAGNVTIDKSHGSVDVNNVTGSTLIRARHSKVTITDITPGSSNYKVTSKHGDISLKLPASSSADIQLKTEHGSISNNINLPLKKRQSGNSASGQLNGGGDRVQLTTDHGDIRLITR